VLKTTTNTNTNIYHPNIAVTVSHHTTPSRKMVTTLVLVVAVSVLSSPTVPQRGRQPSQPGQAQQVRRGREADLDGSGVSAAKQGVDDAAQRMTA
jgi:hypothetical protein